AGGDSTPIIDDYAPSVGMVKTMLAAYAGNEPSDPDRIAQIVLKLAYHEQLPLHLLIGNDALHYLGQAETARAEAAERWLPVSRAADYSAPVELPTFPTH
ncbi:short-chain dehydrogenase/reductase, partial [Pseudomonas gingeri]|nr:short-chain dehydrogenase/reductase [Pseudomonas gingeri]